MWLSLLTFVLLGMTATGSYNVSVGDSNLTFFGAPRAALDSVLPVLSIEEDYIRGQTDRTSNKAFGTAAELQCSASRPCVDGSCCNSKGQCGFRDEHCKNNCVANCDATAPCGKNSKSGLLTCPLNVCCSYFGFCGVSDSFCRDTTDTGQSTPCQKQFGKCGTITPPTCGSSSGTASRKIAYYEGWNTRRRPCDRVFPQNIDTTGLTHLIFSFATIDPVTFAVGPMHPDDEKLYGDFLNLKDGSQKWIGIGGWEFSDAGATRYTWSQMASTKANRGAFISSLQKFLIKWSFQGVDIDWEWPGAESRGGNPAIDMRNQIDLMVELRQALGSRGLSVVLPAQYEYLKYLDPKALEAQIDHFNVLSYDLHGPWDAAIPGEGPLINPHTNLQEIDTALTLFWFNGVNPAKINLGIANYGRGYTVADAGCSKYGCAWTGPSKAGECTQLEGVLSQCEIQRIIHKKNLRPEIIAGGAGVKQISFDGQWVGYDDSETLDSKTGLANNRCLGGTALWAIDYASCGGGSDGPVAPPLSSVGFSPLAPTASSIPAPSSPASSASPPAQSSLDASSAPSSTPISSSTTKTEPSSFTTKSSQIPSTTVPTLPPAGSSVPTKSSQDASTISSGETETGSLAVSSTAVTVAPSFGSSVSASASSVHGPLPPASSTAPVTATLQTSQAWSSALNAPSSVDQTSSGAWTVFSSQIVSTAPPVVVVPSQTSLSFQSSNSFQSLQSSAATTVASSGASSAVQSPSIMSSQGSSVVSSLSSLSAGSSAWTSSTASSFVPVSSNLASASRSSSQATSGTKSGQKSTVTAPSSQVATSTVSYNTLSKSAGSSSWIFTSTITTGTTIGQGTQTLSVTQTVTSWGSLQSQMTSTTREYSQSVVQSSGTKTDSASLSQSSSNVATSATSPAFSESGISSIAATSGASSAPSGASSAPSGASSAPGQTSSGAAKSGVSSWASTTVLSGTSRTSLSSVQASSSATSNPVQTSSQSLQASTEWSSAFVSSGSEASSNAITSNSISSTHSREDNTSKSKQTTGSLIATKSSNQESTGPATYTLSGSVMPVPTRLLSSICPRCPETGWCLPLASKDVNELPKFPPPECLDNEWCTQCWPRPREFNEEICPLQCWLLEWCRPFCVPFEELPIIPPEMGLKLPWFTFWWWKLPVKGCVPNDCKKECIAWYGLTLAIFKRPICPCVPRTCTKSEEKENKDKKKCKLFGCGCGWMGLSIGPGCIDIHVDWPKIFPWGVFGQNPCKWFGGCKFPPGTNPPLLGTKPPPPGPPPDDDNPNNDDFGDEGCGPLGCKGYCYVEGGCEPCPTEICGGPKCTKPGGCGPKTGPDPKPEPTRKSKCEEEQKTTVTERIVSCFVDLQVEPTTIKSINYTLTETLTSACLSFEATYTGCGILGTTTTTTVSSFTTTASSSEAPMCSRAPLDLDNDEGDNEQPTRTTDGSSCTRAPLSLDDDEGDNEQPKSSKAPACTRAPLSLDDDEGNNEMPADLSLSSSMSPKPSANSSRIASSSISVTVSTSANSSSVTSMSMSMTSSTSANSSSIISKSISMTSPLSTNSSSSSTSRVLPPSTLSMPTKTPPWGTGIPSGTPAPGSCLNCKTYFDKVANWNCEPNGSDAQQCAKWSLAELCFGIRSPDYCKTGHCKHSACPKENPGDYSKANPAVPFTTVLSLSSTTVAVTVTPSVTTVSLSASATPTCKPGGSISPHGKWTAYWEQEIKGDKEATFSWTLWDENGCQAGKGSATNGKVLGSNIVTDIGAQDRPQEQKMGYMLHINISDSTSTDRSDIAFTISKPPKGCTEMCWARWKINDSLNSKPWQITDDCVKQCGMQKFNPADVSCSNSINKFLRTNDNRLSKRGGYCWWRMPFEPANDGPPPPPLPFTHESIWRLEIRQQMEYQRSEIEWTLYDPNKQHAGTGWKDTSGSDIVSTIISTLGRDAHPQDKMHYKMQLIVSHPRTKEKSTVTISYFNTGKIPGCKYGSAVGMVPECNPSYQTETDDESVLAQLNDCYTELNGRQYICDRHLVSNTQMSCDAVPRAFYPKNAGFERKFACWWPHDFTPAGKATVAAVEFEEGGDASGNGTEGALRIDGSGNGTLMI